MPVLYVKTLKLSVSSFELEIHKIGKSMVKNRHRKMRELSMEIIKSDYVDIVPTKGLFFDDYSITYDGDYSHITDHEDYSIIRRKLKMILKLINAIPELITKDFETELWPMV